MTKQEVIEKAYGEHWETVKDYVDANGWLQIKKVVGTFLGTKLNLDVIETPRRVRPTSLQGIENNNGWIKIESEEDLPKTTCECWFLEKNENSILSGFYNKDFNCFVFSAFKILLKDVTHYKTIETPKPPIY